MLSGAKLIGSGSKRASLCSLPEVIAYLVQYAIIAVYTVRSFSP